MKKRFIEWDLPLAEISEESAREKNIRHGHPSTLHIWWARRPLASSRATNFAALIDLPDDPEKREEITELIKKITPWEAVKNGNDENIRKAQEMIKEQWGDNPPKVLDPFAGGGSIPFEALRLGCETYASDYNPVAVFIEKATLEWPQKYGFPIEIPISEAFDRELKNAGYTKKQIESIREGKQQSIDGKDTIEVNFLAHMVEKWANIVLEQAREEIGQFYPEEPDGSIPVGYIWARTIPCQNPSCGAEIPLVRQFWLAKKSNKKVAYKPIVDKRNKTIEFEIVKGNMGEFDPGEGTIAQGKAICLICGQPIENKDIQKLALIGKMGERLIAIIFHHIKESGKTYRIVTRKDMNTFKEIKPYLNEKIRNWQWTETPIPDEKICEIRPSPNARGLSGLTRYGFNNFGELFNPRQKLALITFLEKIKLAYEGIKEDCDGLNLQKHGLDSDEAAKAVMGYLGIMLGREADKNSSLCRLIPQTEAIGFTYGRQALPMLWDYIEMNPIEHRSGWNKIVYEISANIQNYQRLDYSINVVVNNASATSLPFPDNHFDGVFTDPPYYDNVPYADLSDFFYVWLKRSVGDVFLELFSTPLTPKSQEAIVNYAHQENPVEFFEKALSESFLEINRVLKFGGITVIVYAHKTTEGWETMLNSLVNAGLVVTASWPIHTEMKARLIAAASAALASSIYMVCRKTERKKVGFYSELQPLIKNRIEEKLQQFWNEGIAGGDFFISAIGPGMEIFSQYERVEKLAGEQVTTAELLDYIRSVSTDFIVNKLLKGASSENIDTESDFYLAFRWTHLDNTVDFDDARKLASASGFSLEDNWGPGGFIKKSGSKISVLGPKGRDEIKSPDSMVDVMHKCLLLWEREEKEEIARLLAETGFKESPAFKQFCQAIAECLLNGNKEKQLLEGFLMGIDDYARIEVSGRKRKKKDKDQTDLKQFGYREK